MAMPFPEWRFEPTGYLTLALILLAPVIVILGVLVIALAGGRSPTLEAVYRLSIIVGICTTPLGLYVLYLSLRSRRRRPGPPS